MGSLLELRRRRQKVSVLVSGATAGPVPAAVRYLRLARALRLPAELVVMDFSPAPTVARALADVPESVPVRRFWREAAPGGGGATPRYAPDATATQAPHPGARDGSWHTAYYRDGRPTRAIVERGECMVVHDYGRGTTPVRRDEIDERGALVRTVDLHPSTGQAVTHRYLDATGRCWLSVWVDQGRFGRTQQHQPTPREFPSLRAAQAAWIDTLLATQRRQALLTAGPGAQAVAQLTRKPHTTIPTK